MTAYLVFDSHGHVVFSIFDTNSQPAISIPCPVSDYWIHKSCERTAAHFLNMFEVGQNLVPP